MAQDNSLRLPTTPQVEQHPQQSEIVRYFRSLNEWLECDVRDRRAEIQSMSVHLDQTHNKVIPLLNQIVQAMDLWREGKHSSSACWFSIFTVAFTGVPPGAARSPSDDLWDVISSHPSTRVAPTISAVSLDKASSSTSSSPGGECPGFPSLRHLHPSHLSVNMGGLPVEPELDRTPAPSLTKTAMPSSDPTEVGNEELVMPEQNDMVRTQLRDLMKLFAEHRDEIARKHELTEERWTANQVRWEDKHAKDAATHNMLERILANQADMMGKFSAFKDEVLAELRKSSVSSADHAITQPPSFHLGPRAPSSLSSPVITTFTNFDSAISFGSRDDLSWPTVPRPALVYQNTSRNPSADHHTFQCSRYATRAESGRYSPEYTSSLYLIGTFFSI
ncbi:hypothetical protein GSI_09150 [Ganoderma sinense ZZ0214-1]|uniref:Uncharacterized protein n=1 Tax=Ganoderma sinense ZZ0214-1 TaxID=1077348 RepID=A0A2G8S5P8_9APHY|nr:hypothetical protein GSI_09150 [Ganoderma sinense ZZ0214-1]